MRVYISRIKICSILIEFLESSDYTYDFRKDETCLQFKMKKHYIKTRKISRKFVTTVEICFASTLYIFLAEYVRFVRFTLRIFIEHT